MNQVFKKFFEEIIKPLLASILIEVLQILIKKISLSLKRKKLRGKLNLLCKVDPNREAQRGNLKEESNQGSNQEHEGSFKEESKE